MRDNGSELALGRFGFQTGAFVVAGITPVGLAVALRQLARASLFGTLLDDLVATRIRGSSTRPTGIT